MKSFRTFVFAAGWAALLLCGTRAAKAQDCQGLIDTIDSLMKKGEYFQLADLAMRADSVCLLEVGNMDKLYGDAITSRGIVLINTGKYADAIPWLRKAAGIYRAAVGADSEKYGGALASIAIAHVYLGQYAEASTAIDTSLRIGLLVKDSTGYASRLSTKAMILFRTGKLGEARSVAEESLELTGKLLGKNDFQYFMRLTVLSSILHQMGAGPEAIERTTEAWHLSRALFGEEHPNFLFISSSLGGLYAMYGPFSKAEKILEPAAAKMSKMLGNAHPNACLTKLNLAGAKVRIGKFDEALAIFESLRSLQRSNKVLDPLSYATLLSNMAIAYFGKKEYRLAMPVIVESCDLIEKTVGRENPDYIRSRNNLGACYYYLANVDVAKSINEENIALSENLDYKYGDPGMLLMNNAQVLHDLGEKEKALEIMRRSAKLILQKNGKESYDYGHALIALGNQLVQLNYPNEALDTLLKGLAAMKAHVGENHTEYAEGLLFTARIYQEAGKNKKARHYFDQALSRCEMAAGKAQMLYPRIAFDYAAFLESRGDTAKARQLYMEAGSIYYQLMDLNFATLGESGSEFFAHQVAKQFDRWKSYGYRHRNEIPEVVSQFYDDELALKGILLHSARTVLEAIQSSGDSILLVTYRRWRSTKQALAHEYSLPVAERKEFTEAGLQGLALQATQDEALLAQGSEYFRRAKQPANWLQVRDALKPGEAAIEFLRFRYHDDQGLADSVYYCALVLHPNDERPKLAYLFEENSLKQQLQQDGCGGEECFDWIYRGKSAKMGAPNYSHLYRLIWQPLESLLNPNDSIIYYAPAGLLHRVAFPAIARTPGELLLDRYDLRCVGSTREVVFEKPLPGKDIRTAWVFGGIQYDTLCTPKAQPIEPLSPGFPIVVRSVSDTIPYLPGTKREGRQVGSLLSESGVEVRHLEGCDAEEGHLKSIGSIGSPAPDVLHLPTHGFFCDTASIRKGLPCPAALSVECKNSLFLSGLLLAGAQYAWSTGLSLKGPEDGILYAYEAAGLNLTGVKLVVLSACETGLGDLRGGEGVYGLPRAFKLAGVERVVMSLWKVPDEPTADFMQALYGYWMNGTDLRAAIRHAQLAMRRKGRHPHEWAGFVLM